MHKPRVHKTVEAIIEANGQVRLLEPLSLDRPVRALVTVLEEDVQAGVGKTALLSEAALAEDWEREEEEEAWRHLQQ